MPVGTNLAKAAFWAAILVGFSYVIVLTPWFEVEDTSGNATLLLAWKGAGVWLLAIYAWLNAKTLDGGLLVGVLGLGSLGDVLMESNEIHGAMAFAIGHVIAIYLYWRNKRDRKSLGSSQTMTGFAFAGLTPIIAAVLTRDGMVVAYAAILGIMAGLAWTSRFTRYRVGIGAAFFIFSDILIFSQLGHEETELAKDIAIWVLYFAGQVLIALGVTQYFARQSTKAI